MQDGDGFIITYINHRTIELYRPTVRTFHTTTGLVLTKGK